MEQSGPLLETLTRRLADTPVDFLAPAKLGGQGELVVAALVHDLLHRHGHGIQAAALRRYQPADGEAERNRLALVAIAVWLLADEWFVAAHPAPERLLAQLDQVSAELAAGAPAAQFVRDAERREELARTMLARLGWRPQGESAAEAADRLTSISGVERQRLLAASREAELRARAVREALAKKAAEESADKWTRE